MGTGSSSGLKRPGRGVDHPSPSSSEVKESVEVYLYSHFGPSWPVLGWPLPLLLLVRSVHLNVHNLMVVSYWHPKLLLQNYQRDALNIIYSSEWRYHMLLMYNYVFLKLSTWYSKHVEESNNIWRINNIQCITLVVLYDQFMMHGQRNIKLLLQVWFKFWLFSTNFVQNTSYSKKNSARYHHLNTLVFK